MPPTTPAKARMTPSGVPPAAVVPPPKSHRHPMPGSRHWLTVLGVIAVILLVLRLLGSPLAKAVVNHRLADLPGYSGHTGAVKLALWRGTLEVDDFVLAERGHEQEPPLLRLRKTVVTFAPSALFRGKLGGTATVDGAELEIVRRTAVDTKAAAEKAKHAIEAKKEQIQRWQDVLRNTFPVTLTKLELKRGRIQYVDHSHQPAVDVALENLHVVGRDLQNRPKANGDPLPAKVDVTGTMTGNGKVRISLQLDPIARQPHFAVKLELREQALPPVNSFLLAYADADVSRGTFELYSEINAQNGAYDGYVKPLFHDLDFRTASDAEKSAAKRLKEKVVSAVASLLKNDEKDQVATKAPFAGNFSDNEVDVWTTIVNLLRNAFVQAIRGGLEGQTPRR